MVAKVTIDESTREQLQQQGELRVVDSQGVPIVLMTVNARQQLHGVTYDDSEMSGDEMMAVLANQLDDPEGMGSPGMDDYDQKCGHLFDQTSRSNQ